jgi:hypothetical protein
MRHTGLLLHLHVLAVGRLRRRPLAGAPQLLPAPLHACCGCLRPALLRARLPPLAPPGAAQLLPLLLLAQEHAAALHVAHEKLHSNAGTWCI